MRNSEENLSVAAPTISTKPSHRLFQLLYLINNKTPVRGQAHSALSILNSLLILFIYLSMPETNLIPSLFQLDNEIIIICLFASLGLILLQLLVGLLYGRQFFVKGQFLAYRYLVLPSAWYLLANYQGQGKEVLIGTVAAVCMAATLVLQWLIGKEGYYNKLLVDNGLPLPAYLLAFELSLYTYATCHSNLQKLAMILMISTALFTKFGVINCNARRTRCLEYTLLRIQANLNLIYSAFIVAQQICFSTESERQPFAFIFPLIMFIVMAEFLTEYSNLMTPISDQFFKASHNAQEFLYYAQYITDDLDRIANSDNQNVLGTCLITIYYEHLRHCKMRDCSVSHQFEAQTMVSHGHYKLLVAAVFKITEQLFQSYLEILYENIELRIALLNFYTRLGPSKFRIMQLIAQTETFSLSLSQKIKLYSMKRFVSDIDVGEFNESRKVEDTFQDFNYSISSLMRLLIEFWAQFLEERVDFQKVLQLAEKITPVMSSVQNQVRQTLETETISTIRILKIYAEYARQIMNDEMKSATISDYANLLSKKMSEIHELNSMTVDTELGLVAISLNVKKLGEIKVANSQAAHMFNYNKQDFLNINVNQIMPSLIGKHHDNFLRVFIVNENKKVNTDRRLLIGRKKEKYLFQIYLQLQKSLITSSQELIFIANIELAKMSEANFIVICDDKGLITDFNSTYYDIFQKSYKKSRNEQTLDKHFSNIQELIPNFFEVALNDVNESKTSIECYDNPIFGILEVKFQITKLSFKEAPDLGYLVKGYRLYEPRPLFYENISLTSSLVQKSDQRELKGMKIQYDSANHEYTFHETLDLFSCGQFQSEYTIPYVKLDLFSNILNQNYDEIPQKHYDSSIKTLRYYNGHFQRVQEPQSFESEIDEEQKSTTNKNRFSIMKQKLKDEEDRLSNKFPQICNALFLIVNLIILVCFYVTVQGEVNEIYSNSEKFYEAYQFRSKLAEYVLYFQAQDDPTYGTFFLENKSKLKLDLINQITKADLPQLQKQKALKVVYLQETLKTSRFEDLINDDTLMITSYTFTKVENHFLIFKILFAVSLGLKLLASCLVMKWHQNKTIEIFSLFLGLTQRQIKTSHQNCVAFLKDSSDFLQKLAEFEADVQYNEQQNPHVKIKRFKNISLGRESLNFLKLNAFLVIFLAFFSALLVNDWITTKQYEKDKDLSEFMYTVMPEYSVKLMKAYSWQKNGFDLALKEQFDEKYQGIDYRLAKLHQINKDDSNFLAIMFSNQCINEPIDLPNDLKCQQICNKVMTGGVSKAINYLSQKLTAPRSLPSSKSLFQLTQMSILLYHLIQPQIQKIKQSIYSQISYEYELNKIYVLLYFIILLVLSVGDTVYQHNYPLHAILRNIVNFRIFINLIPEAKAKVKNGYTQL